MSVHSGKVSLTMTVLPVLVCLPRFALLEAGDSVDVSSRSSSTIGGCQRCTD